MTLTRVTRFAQVPVIVAKKVARKEGLLAARTSAKRPAVKRSAKPAPKSAKAGRK